MSNKYIQIISDSSCDLPADTCTNSNIKIVPFSVTFDGDTYLKERVDITTDDFYKVLAMKSHHPKTSLPSINMYFEAFKECALVGQDIICICLSSKLSGSYNSALNAREMILDSFPDLKIAIIDSHLATLAQGLLVLEAAKLNAKGASFKSIVKALDFIKPNIKVYFTIDDLVFLQKGGRIGKLSGLLGTMFNIKPVISLEAAKNTSGELIPVAKEIGRKNAIAFIVKKIVSDIGDNKKNSTVVVCSSHVTPEALEIEHILRSQHNLRVVNSIFRIGITIGAHIGDTAFGIAYIKN